MNAATSITHSSRYCPASSPPGRRIASRIATNWIVVLSLPQIDGCMTAPSTATPPRSPRVTSPRPPSDPPPAQPEDDELAPADDRHDPRRDPVGADERDQHARDEELVRGRVEERP